MRRCLPALAGCLLAACNSFGDRTTEEDKELNNFAEARQRAATYYDGKDYDRAAAQYKKALEFRPDHLASQLGYAYSLLGSNRPSNLIRAKEEFDEMGVQRDVQDEVKRVYGLAMTCRALAAHFDRRARMRERQGRRSEAVDDRTVAREQAREGIEHFEEVLEIDERLKEKQPVAPMRISASLAPDAHAGIAHCEILSIEEPSPDPNADVNRRIEASLLRAREQIQKFARIAASARKFWRERRERLLTTREFPLEEARDPQARVLDPVTKERYEERIVNTLRQEIAIRRSLLDTLLFLNRYDEAIAEATRILELDNDQDEVLLLRGHAYAFLIPPNYKLALRDLKEYRSRQDLTQLTDEIVALNKRIYKWEKLLAGQPR